MLDSEIVIPQLMCGYNNSFLVKEVRSRSKVVLTVT